MSFLLGKNNTESNVNHATEKGQKELLKFLQSYGLDQGLFPTSGSVDMQPYTDLFTLQNTRNLAQAKESAGNLTGSGFANILGARAGEAATQQGGFLADLANSIATRNQSTYLAAILGALGSPAGGVTHTYTPGLLDYGIQGATAAAPFFAHHGK